MTTQMEEKEPCTGCLSYVHGDEGNNEYRTKINICLENI